MVTPLSVVGVTRYHRPDKRWTKRRQTWDRLPVDVLPFRAFRVGSYILSHADGFVQTQAQIAGVLKISIGTVRAALVDLEGAGFLVRRVIREHGRVIGTAYAVSDTPFTQQEVDALTADDGDSTPCSESVHSESVQPKKTRSRRDSYSGKKTKPSGGSAPAEPPSIQEDEPMPITDQPALFDVQEPPAAEARKDEAPNAGTVVAAYVDSYRRHHSGGDPVKSHIGRVARETKQIIQSGRVDIADLIKAADAMGMGPWSNIGTELNKVRERGGRPPKIDKGIAPVIPREDPCWAELAEQSNRAWAAKLGGAA